MLSTSVSNVEKSFVEAPRRASRKADKVISSWLKIEAKLPPSLAGSEGILSVLVLMFPNVVSEALVDKRTSSCVDS